MTHGVSSLLISAAAGYWVLTHAAKEKGQTKKYGKLLGLLIIVLSIGGAACKIYYQVTNCPPGKYFCPIGGKMGMKTCPMTGQSAAPAATP